MAATGTLTPPKVETSAVGEQATVRPAVTVGSAHAVPPPAARGVIRPRLAALRGNRDFLLLWSGGVISTAGSQLSLVAYPLLVLASSGTAAQAGLLGTVALALRTVLRLPAGALVDRWDRRRVMICCDAARAIVLLLVVAALVTATVTFGLLLAAAAAEAAFTVFYPPAERAALRSIVPVSQLPAALAANEARQHAAELAGPPLGGALFGLGRALPFLGDAISYLLSLAAAVAIRTPLRATPEEPRHVQRRAGLVREIGDGLGFTWRQPLLRATALCVAGTNTVYTALSFAVIVAARHAGATATSIGLMLAAAGVGGLLGALTAPRLITGLTPSGALLVALWAGAVTTPAMAAHPLPALIGPLLAMFAFLIPAANAVLVSSQMAITPEHLQGRVFSSVLFLSGVGGAAAPVLTGLGLDRLGSSAVLILLGAATAMVAALATTSRSIRSLSGNASSALT